MPVVVDPLPDRTPGSAPARAQRSCFLCPVRHDRLFLAPVWDEGTRLAGWDQSSGRCPLLRLGCGAAVAGIAEVFL
jgi:hypothetical protein